MGQVLDITIRLIRRNLRGVLSIALLLLIPVAINGVYLWSTRNINIRFGSDDQINIYILRSLTTGLLVFIIIPFVSLLISRFTLVSAIRIPGQAFETGWQSLAQTILSKWGGLYLGFFTFGLALAVPMALGFFGIISVAVEFDAENQVKSWQAVTVLLSLTFVLATVLGYFLLGFCMFPAIMAGENKGAYDSFVKSWQMVKGQRTRIFFGSSVGFLILAALYSGFTLLVAELTVPFFLMRGLQYLLWETFPIFFIPYQICFLTVCYLNQRVRVDGLDLEWMILENETNQKQKTNDNG